jgi:alpha-ketoglutarate-dependent taurine dioxygenase
VPSAAEWSLADVTLIEPAISTTFPVVISPVPGAGAELHDADRVRAVAALAASGAVLLRGFDLPDEAAFERAAAALSGSLEPSYGDLVKRESASFIYDATKYPNDRAILFHNEGSHTPRLPMRQFFYCGRDGFAGGETPFVDCRKVYRALPETLARDFERKGLLYLRNFIRGVDVRWQDFFRTEDRSVVERTCAEQNVEWAWKRDGNLRISTRVPAVIRTSADAAPSFCNQILLHHISCLDGKTAQAMRAVLPAEDLPRNVCFGDGSPIPDEVVFDILKKTVSVAVRFRWRRGDILMLDNLTTAHARSPFVGERQILVAVGNVVSRGALRAA